MTAPPDFAGLLPDAPAAHAALKAARELVRCGDLAVAQDILAGAASRATPLAQLLRADLLLALGRPDAALTLALDASREHGDTGQAMLTAGHAALALDDRPAAAGFFARAASADPGRIAARVNAAAFSRPPPVTPADHAAVAVTSLPPTADAGCRQALHSWAAAGFRTILSVNTPQEITLLADRFPEAAFVPAPSDALAAFGRPYAALPHLLAAGLANGASTLCVLNADIVLTARPDFAARLVTAAAGGAVMACRVDSTPERPGFGTYYDVGFDLCAVDARYAVRPELDGFFLGLPWWDYALPLAVARAGGILRFCPAPVLRHAVHATAWSHQIFVGLGRQFVDRFWPQAGMELFSDNDRAADGGPEALLAAIGGRTAARLRRAPDAGLWDTTGFCPHDPAYAAALLPLTTVVPNR
ncbi:hypothetical protein [Desulfovibrio sp. TomC]|uniref:hypothetical protein n=1 Tax=Desulfovibrio sp. TomC TaxID=1562888 RepID=UPI000575C5EC|nr:hypothetical protein [Desulfovibrio sp. TomC]KHK03340.1 hypothetical protein NY78_1404 [Desulfovibrio sp. TomC]